MGDPPEVENSTQSTSSCSYSRKISGKCASMPSAQPKRNPSTVNVTGIEPGVYMKETLVFDSMRSS